MESDDDARRDCERMTRILLVARAIQLVCHSPIAGEWWGNAMTHARQWWRTANIDVAPAIFLCANARRSHFVSTGRGSPRPRGGRGSPRPPRFWHELADPAESRSFFEVGVRERGEDVIAKPSIDEQVVACVAFDDEPMFAKEARAPLVDRHVVRHHAVELQRLERV